MQNLEPHPRRPGTFIFATAEEGDLVIEFEIQYDLGGVSMFSDFGNSRPRGIYVDISPVKIERKEYEGQVYTSRVMTISIGQSSRGALIFVEQLPRLNAKKILRAAEFFDEIAPIVANMWITDRPAALQLLKERIVEYQTKYPAKAA